MTYYFWDMDHTIIDNDCDVSWKQFLVDDGLAPSEQLELVDEFYAQYERGELRIDEFLAFQLQEFAGHSVETARTLCERHFESVVRKTILPEARRMIDDQRRNGDVRVLLTATNHEIARPLAEALAFDDVIASELEFEDGRFTGKPSGIYCCAEGKAERLRLYCDQHGLNVSDVHYYGDSISDRFVLELVGHPHAVNPMPTLRELALAKGWDVLDFKGGN